MARTARDLFTMPGLPPGYDVPLSELLAEEERTLEQEAQEQLDLEAGGGPSRPPASIPGRYPGTTGVPMPYSTTRPAAGA